MLLIYTPSIKSRHRYIFNLFFSEIYDIKFHITEDDYEFRTYNGPKINYSDNNFNNEIFIESIGLLNETGINHYNIDVSIDNGVPFFFKTLSSATIPFDIFSASFFLVSRYEEYLTNDRDKHKRFKPEDSIAFKNNFLDKPIINIWAAILVDNISERFPNLNIIHPSYNYLSTIDVDNVFCYMGKGIIRSVLGSLASLLRLDLNSINKRIRVLLGIDNDPYDTFDIQLKIQERYKFDVIYFFLLGDYRKNDKNISYKNEKFRKIIVDISKYAQIGLHPSYLSNYKKKQIYIEKKRMENILNIKVTSSRQHYLKLSLPATYQRLVDLGIKDDYTMGYASAIGFRASICSSFKFYNLLSEEVLPIRIHPFAVMDATLLYYLKLTPKESLSQISGLIKQVKDVNGTFISLWHNESFSDYNKWRGWERIYEEMVELAH
tara:strand:- start:28203 stop:29504 length:1302 start_codon:yes stop_codon:yes gene_type:complete